MAAEAAAKATTTAEDSLPRKGTGPDMVSGGHLVAKALKAEGVDVRHERLAALAL